MTTQIVKIPTSNKWKDSLIESLRNKQHCAVYLESSLEEKDVEKEFLLEIITDVIKAHQTTNNLSKETQLIYEKLAHILTKTGGEEIYSFIDLIDKLGFRLEIKIKNEL